MNRIEKNAYERARRKKHRDVEKLAYIEKIKKEYGARVIPNIPDYYVNDKGRVFSIIETAELKWRMIQKRASVNLRVSLKKYKNWYVHRLVMVAFHGHSELVVNHKDGNPLNNNIDNLEYCTQYENMKHAREVLNVGFIKNGTHIKAKLKEKDVKFILDNKDITNKDLAKKFNVDQAVISNVRRGTKYKVIINKITRGGL